MFHSRVLTEVGNNQPSRLRSRNPLLPQAEAMGHLLQTYGPWPLGRTDGTIQTASWNMAPTTTTESRYEYMKDHNYDAAVKVRVHERPQQRRRSQGTSTWKDPTTTPESRYQYVWGLLQANNPDRTLLINFIQFELLMLPHYPAINLSVFG